MLMNGIVSVVTFLPKTKLVSLHTILSLVNADVELFLRGLVLNLVVTVVCSRRSDLELRSEIQKISSESVS